MFPTLPGIMSSACLDIENLLDPELKKRLGRLGPQRSLRITATASVGERICFFGVVNVLRHIDMPVPLGRMLGS